MKASWCRRLLAFWEDEHKDNGGISGKRCGINDNLEPRSNRNRDRDRFTGSGRCIYHAEQDKRKDGRDVSESVQNAT